MEQDYIQYVSGLYSMKKQHMAYLGNTANHSDYKGIAQCENDLNIIESRLETALKDTFTDKPEEILKEVA
ncbi:MAG: hypothetical protein GY861_17330 [bacterium]|nr:hypothetical protein [bacterium]